MNEIVLVVRRRLAALVALVLALLLVLVLGLVCWAGCRRSRNRQDVTKDEPIRKADVGGQKVD